MPVSAVLVSDTCEDESADWGDCALPGSVSSMWCCRRGRETAAVRSGTIDRTEPYGSRNPAGLENRFSELRCKVTYVRRPDDEIMLCNRKQSSGVENSITTSPGGQSVQNR